jgi:hypothetical protein
MTAFRYALLIATPYSKLGIKTGSNEKTTSLKPLFYVTLLLLRGIFNGTFT